MPNDWVLTHTASTLFLSATAVAIVLLVISVIREGLGLETATPDEDLF